METRIKVRYQVILYISCFLDTTISPIKAPKRTGNTSQITSAAGAVSNWAPLSRLKNQFSNSAMSVNNSSSGNGIGGVSGLKNKLATPFISSSRQDFSGSTEFATNKENQVSSLSNDLNKSDQTDHVSKVPPPCSNNVSTPTNHNDTIISNEIEGVVTDGKIKPEISVEIEDDDSEDSNSAMEFVRGRPLDEELWFHGVLPRGDLYIIIALDNSNSLHDSNYRLYISFFLYNSI